MAVLRLVTATGWGLEIAEGAGLTLIGRAHRKDSTSTAAPIGSFLRLVRSQSENSQAREISSSGDMRLSRRAHIVGIILEHVAITIPGQQRSLAIT